MTTEEVANRLVQLCRANKNIDAKIELYHDDIISIEPKGAPVEKAEGREAVLEKAKYWYNMLDEIHSTQISDPITGGRFFSCTMKMDVTLKEHGRLLMDELCIYEVKDGKIIYEQFFYDF